MVLGERLAQELKELYTKLNNDGKLLSKAQLEGYYETFRKRFGPDQLGAVDGEALLEFMHDHGNHDSLVYWLEFKNDEDGSSLRTMKNSRRGSGASPVGAP